MRKAPLILAGLTALLSGCIEIRTEYSDVRHENAVVSEKRHRNGYTTYMKVNKITIPIHHSEKNYINFDGEIDFEINDKELYALFEEGDNADVSYKERYWAYYDNKDRVEKELVKKELRGYDFVDAKKEIK